jgi:hypothetical protein
MPVKFMAKYKVSELKVSITFVLYCFFFGGGAAF